MWVPSARTAFSAPWGLSSASRVACLVSMVTGKGSMQVSGNTSTLASQTRSEVRDQERDLTSHCKDWKVTLDVCGQQRVTWTHNYAQYLEAILQSVFWTLKMHSLNGFPVAVGTLEWPQRGCIFSIEVTVFQIHLTPRRCWHISLHFTWS